MKVEAYDSKGSQINKGDRIERLCDNTQFNVVEILPKNMVRCNNDEFKNEYYIFVGEGLTKL